MRKTQKIVDPDYHHNVVCVWIGKRKIFLKRSWNIGTKYNHTIIHQLLLQFLHHYLHLCSLFHRARYRREIFHFCSFCVRIQWWNSTENNHDNNSHDNENLFVSCIQSREEDPKPKERPLMPFRALNSNYVYNFQFPHRNRFIYKMIGFEKQQLGSGR